MSDPTEAEKAAMSAAIEYLDNTILSGAAVLAHIIECHMQPVIDAARVEATAVERKYGAVHLRSLQEQLAKAEGCKPTQDDRAAARNLWEFAWARIHNLYRERVRPLVKTHDAPQDGPAEHHFSEAIAKARAEGRRERDEDVEHNYSDCPFRKRLDAAEAALERVRALWPHIEIPLARDGQGWPGRRDPGAPTCLRCKIEEAIRGAR